MVPLPSDQLHLTLLEPWVFGIKNNVLLLILLTEQKGLIATLVAIWLLSLAGSSPQFYEYSLYEHFEEEENETEIACGSHGIAENFESIYAGVVVCIAYILPLVVIILNYSNLAYFLWKVSDFTIYYQTYLLFPAIANGHFCDKSCDTESHEKQKDLERYVCL